MDGFVFADVPGDEEACIAVKHIVLIIRDDGRYRIYLQKDAIAAAGGTAPIHAYNVSIEMGRQLIQQLRQLTKAHYLQLAEQIEERDERQRIITLTPEAADGS